MLSRRRSEDGFSRGVQDQKNAERRQFCFDRAHDVERAKPGKASTSATNCISMPFANSRSVFETNVSRIGAWSLRALRFFNTSTTLLSLIWIYVRNGSDIMRGSR
jgi:hypothetical protein